LSNSKSKLRTAASPGTQLGESGQRASQVDVESGIRPYLPEIAGNGIPRNKQDLQDIFNRNPTDAMSDSNSISPLKATGFDQREQGST